MEKRFSSLRARLLESRKVREDVFDIDGDGDLDYVADDDLETIGDIIERAKSKA